MARTRKSTVILAATTGFTAGNWDNTFQAIADARNDTRPQASKQGFACLVEKFTFDIHPMTRKGTMAAKATASLELPRTRAAVERAAADWSKAHPGEAFTIVYRGWFDGSDCLPRYNNPTKKRDRVERIVSFTLPVYTHSGVQGEVKVSAAEKASQAVMAALDAQA